MPTIQVKCTSCGATYPQQEQGKTYLPHVCPETLIEQHAQCDPVTGKTVKEATYITVAYPRNENFVPHPQRKGESVMVSEGLGVTHLD